MAGSPTDAISQAIERSKQLLFPFKAEKWFALGFTVFLAQCGESSGSAGSLRIPSFPTGTFGPGPAAGRGSAATPEFQRLLEEALHALHADLGLWVGIALGVFVVALGMGLVVAWFSSRAKLMLIESIVWDRVEIGTQWSRAGALGMSLFKFRAVLGLGGSFVMLGAVAAAVVVGLPDFQTGQFLGSLAVTAYSIFLGAALLIGLPLALVSALTEDFVAPLMVLRNVRVGQAWAMCRAEVLGGNVGGIIVFYLLRFVLALGVAIAASIVACLTCCLTAIPYIGTVILLPIWLFWRAYPLYYLEQLGVQVFPLPEPSWAAYERWQFPR